LYRPTWAAIGGGGRSGWTDDEWTAELSRPNVRTWVAVHGGRDVGMAQLAWSGSGDAGFVVLGVLPAFPGMGIGGDFLTRLTRLMWRTPAANGCPTRRVWLWTVPGEHPHAIPNYLARGFVRGPDID
jgi:GNAT superfamily N-acetyltransferase